MTMVKNFSVDYFGVERVNVPERNNNLMFSLAELPSGARQNKYMYIRIYQEVFFQSRWFEYSTAQSFLNNIKQKFSKARRFECKFAIYRFVSRLLS